MTSKVYFIELADRTGIETCVQAIRSLFKASNAASVIDPKDFLAVKVHVGEKGNVTHIPADLVAAIVGMAKDAGAIPFLTDTSTLYKGERSNGVNHILHAYSNGFTIDKTGAPFIPADGLAGNTETEVVINGELHESVHVAREILVTDSIMVLSHCTGHMCAGLGSSIKNLGMGLSSRMGKMRQHSVIQPEVIKRRCTACEKCMRWCPENAIEQRDGSSFILAEKCIGCGECIAVCRFEAIKYDFESESVFLQKSMAEHALGCLKDKKGKAFYFNVLLNMTKDCDCMAGVQKKCIPDIGILASDDPVAIDKAALDLTENEQGINLARLSYPHLDPMVQLKHAEKMGLGSLEYEIEHVL